MDLVKWGLLSTANINRRLIPAIEASERGVLAAVASRDLARAQAYAAEWQIPQAFGSYEAMLDSDVIDAVYISLPNHLHAEWSIKALEAGKHVLCEKPFAISLDEVDAMIAKADETGLALAEAFMYRHHPQTKIVGEWVHSGRLGETTVIQSMFNFTGLEAGNVRLNADWGGGAMWDVGVYPMSLSQYLMGGPPEWVFGEQWLGPSGVDEVFCGQLHYAGGGMAQISCSFRTPFCTYAEIIGTEGRLSMNRPFVGTDDEVARLLYTPPDGQPQVVPVPEEPLYLGEVEDLQAAILDGQPNYLSLAESRNHIRTVLTLYESARLHQAVSLS
jgi:xylose dehydrogenase (NAD/NADP)